MERLSAAEQAERMSQSYAALPNKTVQAANNVSYAYRDTEDSPDGALPLVLLQHFRGNLDYWDPALIDELAHNRRVIAFDNAGVGGSTGTTPDTIELMARDAMVFISALGLRHIDLLGFSIGSFVAQEIALRRPALVRRVVLASSAPKGASRVWGFAPSSVGEVETPESAVADYLKAFYATSPTSQQAGQQSIGRMFSHPDKRDEQVGMTTIEAQYEAARSWGLPDSTAMQRLEALACQSSSPTAKATR